jgi:hypothetical protein
MRIRLEVAPNCLSDDCRRLEDPSIRRRQLLELRTEHRQSLTQLLESGMEVKSRLLRSLRNCADSSDDLAK